MIRINGENYKIENKKLTLYDLLKGKGIDPQLAVVEYNGNIAPREGYTEIVLKSGDCLEVIHFVGGG